MIRSNINLVKYAAIGGVATVAMGWLYRWKIHDNIKETVYYREALQTLRSHKPAVHLLGEPIKVGNVDIDNLEKNYTRQQEARYEVPVKGPKDRGTLFFRAKKLSDNQWVVSRIELQLKSDVNRRLVIKKDDTEAGVVI